MCLLLYYINPEANSEELYLILVSIRDEIYNRPTQLAEFWERYPDVIGGRDLEPGKEGGTWLAVSKTGKIGILLNILQPDEELLPNKKGRGFLVVDYVVGNKDPLTYLKELSSEGENYNEFFLVTMDYSSANQPKVACYNNHSPTASPTLLKSGIHAFGNSINPLEIHWPKVSEAKKLFCDVIKGKTSVEHKKVLVNELFLMLRNTTRYPLDEIMKKQGKDKSLEFLEKLNTIFVAIPEANYGSRCHTVVTIDGSGNVDYFERSRPEVSAPPEINEEWISNHYSFKLQSSG